jgi:L-histidine N-alpha-methyltransferase
MSERRSAIAQVVRARSEADERARMAEEVRAGLRSSPLPTLPSKYFYDARGSALFDEITRLPEYYPFRAEERILERVADGVASRFRPREVAELGCGTGRKTRLVLDAVARQGRLERCVLLDVDEAALRESAARLERDYGGLAVRLVVGDFERDLSLLGPGGGRLLMFLGGTIGNLPPEEVPGFLRAAAATLASEDAFLLGLDLVKDVGRLEAAYDDAAGVTARFNRNILRVVNDRLGGDFEPEAFEHVAFYDRERDWIEMRLRATKAMRVRVPASDLTLRLAAGDEIRTEISCKYTRSSLERLLEGTGLRVADWLTDDEGLFALALLRGSA